MIKMEAISYLGYHYWRLIKHIATDWLALVKN